MRRLIAISVLVAALAIGIAWFPRSYEPGRAEADGPNLTLVEDGRLNADTWSVGRFDGSVATSGSGLRINADDRGRVLISRTLALFDDTCYILDARASADRLGLRVDVLDERAKKRRAIVAIAAGTGHNVLPFVSNSRRVTLLVRAEGPVRATMHSIALERDRDAC